MKPLTRVFGVLSVLLVASCAQSTPTGPSAPGPTNSINLSGDWQGTFTPRECELTGWDGSVGPCLNGVPGYPAGVRLTLTDVGGMISGNMRISARVPVTGTRSPTGTLQFSGTVTLSDDISSVFPSDEVTTVQDWTTTYDTTTDTMSGSMWITSSTYYHATGRLFRESRTRGTITDLKRLN